MVQRPGFYNLKKNLTVDKLNKEIGSLYVKDQTGRSSVKRGLALQKLVTGNLSNKSKGEAKKYFIKYGVQGSQGAKREKMIELMFGGSSKKISGMSNIKTSDGRGFLTEKQVANNRRRNRQRDDLTREDRKEESFAGGAVLTRSIGISEAKKNKDSLDSISAKSLGIGKNNTIGFAGQQPNKPVIGVNTNN